MQRQVTRTALRRSLRLEAEREIGRLASVRHNPWPRATPTSKRVVSASTTLAASLLHWRWYSTYPTPARREWCEATRDMPLDEAVRRMDGLATLNSSHVPHSAGRGLPPRTQRAHLPLSQEMGAASGLPLQSRCRRRLTALRNTINVVRVGEGVAMHRAHRAGHMRKHRGDCSVHTYRATGAGTCSGRPGFAGSWSPGPAPRSTRSNIIIGEPSASPHDAPGGPTPQC